MPPPGHAVSRLMNALDEATESRSKSIGVVTSWNIRSKKIIQTHGNSVLLAHFLNTMMVVVTFGTQVKRPVFVNSDVGERDY